MPGYMMHLCEGAHILNSLRLQPSGHNYLSEGLSPDFCNDFLLGCVIPDAVSDKSRTHFRPEWQRPLITKYPDIPYILSKYDIHSMTAADLGILAHLMMDTAYVTSFWPRFFRFEDASGNATNVTDQIDHVHMSEESMQPAGADIAIQEFFSCKYFYGDYDITNIHFYKAFSPNIPVIRLVDITISECLCFSPDTMLNDLHQFAAIDGDMANDTQSVETKVFPYQSMVDFVTGSAQDFIRLLSDL